MYTKLDLIENEKMNRIIKENKERMSKRVITKKRTNLLLKVLASVSVLALFFGFMFLIALIENWSF